MTRTGLQTTLARIADVIPDTAGVKVGIEAAGHYHQPLMAAASWPPGWELLELSGHRASSTRIDAMNHHIG